MNDTRPPGPDRLPTLTEVLEPEVVAAAAVPGIAASPADEQAIAREVLADLWPRIDPVFDDRLREALGPALARAADTLIRESRQELHLLLRELVEAAVARALEKRRGN